jgi:DNA repair photolyase
LIQHRAGANRPVGGTSLRQLEAIFKGEGGKPGALFRQALRYDRRNKAGFPCPVQLGAINDPCDHIERQQGWLLEFIDLAARCGQPVRMSTKGTVLQEPDYLEALGRRPDLWWVAFSIISVDDDVMAAVDRRAPSPSQRLETMAAISKLGVKTSLRFRPIMPGISDSTARHPQAWRELIDRAYEAGARAVSYEVAFVPGGASPDIRRRWEDLSAIARVPYFDLYGKFGKMTPCTRPSYAWTEEIMHRIRDHAESLGMTVGVSDPVWKQLTGSGNCCGILADDPVFGNWQTESATNQLVLARDTGKILTANDIIPAWAHHQSLSGMVNPGVGPKSIWRGRHVTWADKLRSVWNDLRSERGPLQYFQGALQPVGRDDNGDVSYKYVGLKRQNLRHPPFWNLDGTPD